MAIRENLLLKGKADFKQIDKEAKRSKRSLGDMAAGFGDAMLRVNAALAVAQTAVRALGAAFDLAKFAGKFERLENLVGEGFASRLRRATGDTITSMEAMESAAQIMASSYELTSTEMEDLFTITDDLTKLLGTDFQKQSRKLFRALTEGTQDLERFGFKLDGIVGAAARSEAAIAQLHERSKNPLALSAAADEFDAFDAEIRNMVDDLKFFAGALVREIFLFIKEISPAFEQLAKLMDVRRKGLEKADRARQAQRDREKILRRLERQDERDAQEAARTVKIDFVPGFDFLKPGVLQEQFAKQVKSRPIKLTAVAELKLIFKREDEDEAFREELSDTVAELEKEIKAAQFGGGDFLKGILGEAETVETAEQRKRDARAKTRADLLQTVDAELASQQAILGAVGAGADLAEEIFGKSKAITIANAGIQVLVNIAEANSAFARTLIPQGVMHLLAAAKWGVIAGKSAAGGSGGGGGSAGSRGGAGGGFSRPGGSGGGQSQTVTVIVNAGIGAQPDEIGVAVRGALTSAQRHGAIETEDEQAVVDFR